MCMCSQSLQSCPTHCDPKDCSPPGSSVHGDSPGKNTGVGCHVLLHGIFPTQGSNSGLPPCRIIRYHLKPKSTGVGSLSLLQEIFPTQESNQVLLHYRQILYQLSYEHIFSWLKSKHTYSLVKYLLGLFFHYSFGFFVFIQSCKSSLYILNVSLISNMECIYFLLVFVLSFYFLQGVF